MYVCYAILGLYVQPAVCAWTAKKVQRDLNFPHQKPTSINPGGFLQGKKLSVVHSKKYGGYITLDTM